MTPADDDLTLPRESRLHRVLHTPISELLGLKVAARADARREITAAGLPEPIAAALWKIVEQTRLWRSEKLDVARELIAHFADGLAAGRTSEALLADFGSPADAARLIRQAKVRCRPLWWRASRFAMRAALIALGMLLLIYAWLAARFFLGTPQIAHNYWEDLNTARTVPDDQRGWLSYRSAMFKLGRTRVDSNWLDFGPEGKHYDRALSTLKSHRAALDLIREGSKRPRFGFLIGDAADQLAATQAGSNFLIDPNEPKASDNQVLMMAILDGPQQMRSLARLMALDARRAAIEGDGAMVVADLTALINMAQQMQQPPAFVVEQLIGMAIFGMTMETFGRILAETPEVLSDDQLIALAHRLAAYNQPATSVDLSSEQMMFDDLVQRTFTDDGHGDGRLTPEGLTLWIDVMETSPSWLGKRSSKRKQLDTAWLNSLGPGLSVWVADRKEMGELYRSLLNEIIVGYQGLPWLWDAVGIDARIKGALHSPGDRERFFLVSDLLPAVHAVFHAAERTMQQRDAAEVVIALELWRRRYGEWPAELAQLVPELLPAVPLDRFDGQPLRYMVRDGRPVVYSIGDDRKDDRGRPTTELRAAFGIGKWPWVGRTALPDESQPEVGGDWILWPPLATVEEEE